MPRTMNGWLGVPNMRTINEHVFFILRFTVGIILPIPIIKWTEIALKHLQLDLMTLKTLKNMYYNIKYDIYLRTHACFSHSSYGVAILDALLNNSKRSLMPGGHHSDSDSTLLPPSSSAITWFGGNLARLAPLAAGLYAIIHKPHFSSREGLHLSLCPF